MVKSIIDKFLKEHNYLESEKVLGIIFYGSYLYNRATKDSDIDLFILTKDNKNYRGVCYIDDIQIEYFEKSFSYLESLIEEINENADRSLISVFKNGEIVFSKDGSIEYLKDYILCSDNEKKVRQPVDFERLLDFRNNMIEAKEGSFKKYLYHNLLEEYRKNYHRKYGYSNISPLKVYDLYNDSEYSKKCYCVFIPDKDFRDRYCHLLLNYDYDELCSLTDKYNDNFIKDNNEYYSKNRLISSSVILNQIINKCSQYKKNNHQAFDAAYYLSLEKVRLFYCHRYGISDSISSLYECDSKFIEIFSNCLAEIKVDNLKDLFNYATNGIDINYRDYKVLDIK